MAKLKLLYDVSMGANFINSFCLGIRVTTKINELFEGIEKDSTII